MVRFRARVGLCKCLAMVAAGGLDLSPGGDRPEGSVGMHMKVSRVRQACASALLAGFVGMVALAPVAQAHHIPGATYRGSRPDGGSVEFDVSGDGTRITRVRVSGRGDICEGTLEVGLNEPITNHAFNNASADPLAFSGSFPTKQSAQGTLSLDIDIPGIGRCRTGTVSWTATTIASAAGSEECRNALAAVNAAQVQANSGQAAATSAQNAADTAGATIAADKRKLKNGHKRLRKASTSAAKKKIQKLLKLENRDLARARTALTNAATQQQTAAVQQQDAATQQQTAAGQQQAEC